MRLTKKVVSIILAVMLVATLVPMAAISTNAAESAPGSNVNPVSTWSELVSAMSTGGNNYYLTDNITFEDDLTVSATSNTAINLNGYNLNLGSYSILLTSGIFSLKDISDGANGTITGSSTIFNLTGNGQLKIFSGNIVYTGTDVAIVNEANAKKSITVNGGSVSAVNGTAFSIYGCYSSFTVNDGTISAKYIVHIKAKSITNLGYNPQLVGGNYTYTEDLAVVDADYTQMIYDRYYTLFVSAGYGEDVIAANIWNNVKQRTLYITGGTYSNDFSEWILTTQVCQQISSGYILISTIRNASEFKTAIHNGGYYKLTADIEVFANGTDYYTQAEKTVEIFGDGHTVTAGDAMEEIFYVCVSNAAGFTFHDTIFDGNHNAEHLYWNLQTNTDANQSTVLNLDGCTVKNFDSTSGYGAILTRGSQTVSITDTQFIDNTCDDGKVSDIFVASKTDTTISGCLFEGGVFINEEGGGYPDVTIEDSQIATLTLEENSLGQEPSSTPVTLKDSVVSALNVGSGDADVIDNDGSIFLATAGYSGTGEPLTNDYLITTEAQLKTACKFGGSYKLGSDITLTEAAVIPADNYFGENTVLTLDLNGCDISGDVNAKMIQNNGTLTINDTSTNPGHVYNTNVSKQGNDAVVNYGTLTIENGYFGDSDSDQTNANAYNRGGAVRNLGGTLTIDGGYFTACDNFTNGGYAYAIINDDDGTVVINDATVYGKNNGNIANNSGTAEINGGTFTLNGEKSYYTFYAYEGNITVNDATVEHVAPQNVACYADTDASVDINGGTFTVNENKNFGNSAEGVTIYGGTFSKNVYEFISDEHPSEFNIRNTDGTNTASNNPEVLSALIGVNSTAYDDWSGLGDLPLHNLEILGFQKKSNTTKADGNEYATHGVRFVAVVNEGLLKSANIDDYGFVLAKASGLNQNEIGDKFNNMKYNGTNGERTESCKGSSNTLSGDYGKYSKSTTYKYVTAAVNGMSAGEQVVARFYIKTTTGHIYYANYYGTVTSSGLVATMS